MKKFFLIITVTTAIFILVPSACSRKPKLEGKKDHPAVMENTEETSPAVERSDSSKPKDHPAH